MALSKRIEHFYAKPLSEEIRLRNYLRLSPSGIHDYYVLPSRSCMNYLADVIDGKSYRRTVGSLLLRLFSSRPRMARYLPYLDSTKLPVGTESYPELIVVSDHIRLISRAQKVVHSLPYKEPERVRHELEVRLMLPESLFTPELIRWDKNQPFFTEEFIDGELVGPPTSNWEYFDEAIRQLACLYNTTLTEEREVNEWIDSRSTEISDSPLPDDLVNTYTHIINELRTPETIREARVHGDLNQRNLLSSNGEIYIVDWEDSRIGLPTADFLRPFLIQYYDSRDISPFVQMIEKEQPGFGYIQDFVDRVGPIMYDSKEWYEGLLPIAILEILANIEPSDDLWYAVRELLQKLVRYWTS